MNARIAGITVGCSRRWRPWHRHRRWRSTYTPMRWVKRNEVREDKWKQRNIESPKT